MPRRAFPMRRNSRRLIGRGSGSLADIVYAVGSRKRDAAVADSHMAQKTLAVVTCGYRTFSVIVGDRRFKIPFALQQKPHG